MRIIVAMLGIIFGLSSGKLFCLVYAGESPWLLVIAIPLLLVACAAWGFALEDRE